MKVEQHAARLNTRQKQGIASKIASDFKKFKYIYIMLIPLVLYYAIFHYQPMYGAIIAFKNFKPVLGILGSKWIGFRNFIDFFQSPYFVRVLKNTIIISLYSIIFGFPAPILLAVLLNEIRSSIFKRTVQSLTYLPHFLSMVVICGMIVQFTATNGIITKFVNLLVDQGKGGLIANPNYFRGIYVVSGIWLQVGWGSIIYLAAISGIDQQQYESAHMDGANKFRMIWHITLPGIMPTVVILFILRIGNIMSVGWMKIMLLYSPLTYEKADVISTYVYRKGITEMQLSFATAVGLFNSIINFMLLIIANKISRKVNETSLW